MGRGRVKWDTGTRASRTRRRRDAKTRGLGRNGFAGTRGLGDARTRGRGDAGTRGRGDAGTRGRGDAGTRGRGDAGTRGRGDAGKRGRGEAGTRGRWNVGHGNFGTRGRDFQQQGRHFDFNILYTFILNYHFIRFVSLFLGGFDSFEILCSWHSHN